MFKISSYSDRYFDRWNQFVATSNNGTIFHRLDFLNYHGDKFKQQEHNLLWFKGEALYAVMPFAIFEVEGKRIGKSPYGASFGGIVVGKKFRLKDALELYKAFDEYVKYLQLDEVYLNTTPSFYSERANFYSEFVLSRDGFSLESREIFNVVPLGATYEETWSNFEGRSRTTIRRSKDNFDMSLNVSVEEFYPILLEDKIRHNNAKPTHSLEELKVLKEQFPEKVFFDVATLKKNGARAGICYFICNSKVIMTFYMAQETLALRENGTNILLEEGMKRAINKGLKYLDFGGSTIGYTIQNMGVAEFKESFGATAYLRERYSKLFND